jgi:dephospho-CoA kinase
MEEGRGPGGESGPGAGFVVGLTGGIGSGKSAAAERFAALGTAVVDTDAIAHELTGPDGAAIPQLRARFGDAVIAADGRLDRTAMRRLAFGDAGARKQLEGILHPRIRAESDCRCRRALATGAPYVVLVIPLLVESGDYRRRLNRVAVVDCDDDLRVARVMARSKLSRAEVLNIMAAQASRAERLAVADDIIDNGGSLEALAARVGQLHLQYLSLANQAKRARQTG